MNRTSVLMLSLKIVCNKELMFPDSVDRDFVTAFTSIQNDFAVLKRLPSLKRSLMMSVRALWIPTKMHSLNRFGASISGCKTSKCEG